MGLGFLLCFGEGWGLFVAVVLVGWFLRRWGEMECNLKVQKHCVLYFVLKLTASQI